MAVEIKLRMEALRSLAFGSMGAAYVAVGTAIDNPARMIIIDNFTDADLMISFTGNTDHMVIKANSGKVIDGASNKTTDDGFFFTVGTRLHVKNIGTPTTGSVYFTSIYGARR